MRPAQLTPENLHRRAGHEKESLTSMRPAQLTPENDFGHRSDLADQHTSMRPAQLTPENPAASATPPRPDCHFNEAGAINAGKRHGQGRPSGAMSYFNEAGAINAGKLVRIVQTGRDDRQLQ